MTFFLLNDIYIGIANTHLIWIKREVSVNRNLFRLPKSQLGGEDRPAAYHTASRQVVPVGQYRGAAVTLNLFASSSTPAPPKPAIEPGLTSATCARKPVLPHLALPAGESQRNRPEPKGAVRH